MRSPATDILETALALHRAPGERFRLRGRPLPEGIVHLIELAGGAPDALREAAAELGEPEARILEASRFYLEQMLFADPGADAYRVLGVARDAPAEQIRRHHRLLQRWLHPDRAIAGDAAVFATRVNQAWGQLRAPELREAYDARLASAGVADDAGAATAPQVPPIRLWQDEGPAPATGRRSRWLAGAALAACAVLVFLMYRAEQRPEPGHAFDIASGPAPASVAGEAEARQRPPPDPVLQEALARALEPAVDLLPAAADGEVPGPVPAPEPAPAPAPEPGPPPAPEPAPPAPAPVVARAPAPEPAPAPVRVAARAHVPVAAPAPAARIAAAPVPPPEVVPATLPAATRPPPARPPESPDPATRLLAERLRKAELRMGQVTAYLASSPEAAPMWNDIATAEHAAGLRARFQRHDGCPQFEGEVWRLHLDNAHASTAWRCRGERGRLDVELVWREGMWLVRGLDMAPPA